MRNQLSLKTVQPGSEMVPLANDIQHRFFPFGIESEIGFINGCAPVVRLGLGQDIGLGFSDTGIAKPCIRKGEIEQNALHLGPAANQVLAFPPVAAQHWKEVRDDMRKRQSWIVFKPFDHIGREPVIGQSESRSATPEKISVACKMALVVQHKGRLQALHSLAVIYFGGNSH